jgi:hypothetical protein
LLEARRSRHPYLGFDRGWGLPVRLHVWAQDHDSDKTSAEKRATNHDGRIASLVKSGEDDASLAFESAAGESCQRVPGYESVTAGIAGPEIADDIFGNISRRFCGHHRICTDRTGRQIASARIRSGRESRQTFSNRWHRDLLPIRN